MVRPVYGVPMPLGRHESPELFSRQTQPNFDATGLDLLSLKLALCQIYEHFPLDMAANRGQHGVHPLDSLFPRSRSYGRERRDEVSSLLIVSVSSSGRRVMHVTLSRLPSFLLQPACGRRQVVVQEA